MTWDPYAIPIDSAVVHGETIHRGNSVTYSWINPLNGKIKYASSEVNMLTKSGIIYLKNGLSFKVDGNENIPGIQRRPKIKFLEGLTSTVEKRLPPDELSPSTLDKIIAALKQTNTPSGEPPCQPPPAT